MKTIQERENKALEFEALICEVQAISIKMEAMRTANKEREMNGQTPAYHEQSFLELGSDMVAYADKFRRMKE